MADKKAASLAVRKDVQLVDLRAGKMAGQKVDLSALKKVVPMVAGMAARKVALKAGKLVAHSVARWALQTVALKADLKVVWRVGQMAD